MAADRPAARGGIDHTALPVSYSTLDAGAVRAELLAAYALATPVECRLLKPGSNDSYLVTTGTGRYVARVYRARWRTPSEIAYELDLLFHLAARRVPVAVPIRDRDGNLLRSILAPEGARQLVLFTHIEGTHASWEQPHHCHRAGRSAAAIHLAADDFVSNHRRAPLDLKNLVDRPLAVLRPFLEHRPADRDQLNGLAAGLKTNVAAAAGAGLDWGVCHGDFGAKNILIRNGRLTVLDFDHCAPGWRIYDFAPVYRSASGSPLAGNWQAFLKGYQEIRPLTAVDLAAIPLLRALRHLHMLGLFAENAADWGSAPLSDQKLDGWLAWFRQWEADHADWRWPW